MPMCLSSRADRYFIVQLQGSVTLPFKLHVTYTLGYHLLDKGKSIINPYPYHSGGGIKSRVREKLYILLPITSC